MRHTAFSLVEILVVVGIMLILAALLFPVFATVQGKARASSCQSNLHQIGQAIVIYTQDYERYPRGLDPADKFNPQIWNGKPNVNSEILENTPLLSEVMHPYIKSSNVWNCPSDFGFKTIDLTNTALEAEPSCFDRFGMSYLYRTEVTLLDLSEERLSHPSEANILADASGSWHGGESESRRYNVLFGDGHVKSLGWDAYNSVWDAPVVASSTHP